MKFFIAFGLIVQIFASAAQASETDFVRSFRCTASDGSGTEVLLMINPENGEQRLDLVVDGHTVFQDLVIRQQPSHVGSILQGRSSKLSANFFTDTMGVFTIPQRQLKILVLCER